MMTTAVSEAIHVGQVRIRFLLEGEETNGSLSMFEAEIPAGARVPAAHSHDRFDEVAYGLDGVCVWTIGGVRHEIGPGDSVFIPRGVPHRFDNEGDVTARQLAVATPGLMTADYFREIGEALNGGGPPDIAQIHEIMRRYGMTPVSS